MAEKIFKGRIVQKHDIEANWLLATNFTPKQGEIIVYDIDDNYSYERLKIGDGVQNVNDLPFYAGSWNDLEDRPVVMESVTITYDGSTDGYITSAPVLYYKVSDLVLTKENIIGQSISLFNRVSVNTVTITEDTISTLENPNSFAISEFVICIAEDNTIFNSYTFPEKGVYFANINGIYVASLGAVNVGPFFDEKYIPSTIARREEIVQSDWSEGNQSSLSYVKNKTHYYYEGASIVEELSVTVTDEDFTNIGPYLTLEEGKKYKVVIDGVMDICTAVHVHDAAAANNYIELVPTIEGFGIVRSRLTGGVCTYISGVSLGDHVLSIYEDNELKQLDEMFIPDTIARVSDIDEIKNLVGDTAVSTQIENAIAEIPQADWNQNDETAKDYIKNKPFGETEEIVFPETTVEGFTDDDGFGIYRAFDTSYMIIPTTGDTFNVFWDNEIYSVTCTDNGYIGNRYIEDEELHEDTGEPFLIISSRRNQVFYTNRSGNSHTIGVAKNVITTIDQKYIPNADWSQSDPNGEGYIKNKPNEQDALELVAELGLVSPVAADDGSIYTDENGALYSL